MPELETIAPPQGPGSSNWPDDLNDYVQKNPNASDAELFKRFPQLNGDSKRIDAALGYGMAKASGTSQSDMAKMYPDLLEPPPDEKPAPAPKVFQTDPNREKSVRQEHPEITDLHDSKFVDSVLDKNKDKNFVQRYLNPSASPVIKNDDGTISTHRMASSDNLAYPTIVQQPDGTLKQLGDKDAYRYAIKNKEYIAFKNEKDADWFATNGYKLGSQNAPSDENTTEPKLPALNDADFLKTAHDQNAAESTAGGSTQIKRTMATQKATEDMRIKTVAKYKPMLDEVMGDIAADKDHFVRNNRPALDFHPDASDAFYEQPKMEAIDAYLKTKISDPTDRYYIRNQIINQFQQNKDQANIEQIAQRKIGLLPAVQQAQNEGIASGQAVQDPAKVLARAQQIDPTTEDQVNKIYQQAPKINEDMKNETMRNMINNSTSLHYDEDGNLRKVNTLDPNIPFHDQITGAGKALRGFLNLSGQSGGWAAGMLRFIGVKEGSYYMQKIGDDYQKETAEPGGDSSLSEDLAGKALPMVLQGEIMGRLARTAGTPIFAGINGAAARGMIGKAAEGALGGIATAPINSAIIAHDYYTSQIKAGETPDIAHAKAMSVFGKNLITDMAISPVQFGIMNAPAEGLAKKVLQYGVSPVVAGGHFMAQDFFQQKENNPALTAWEYATSPEGLKTGLAGALTGIVQHYTIGKMNDWQNEKNLKDAFSFGRAGQSPETANLPNNNVIAATVLNGMEMKDGPNRADELKGLISDLHAKGVYNDQEAQKINGIIDDVAAVKAQVPPVGTSMQRMAVLNELLNQQEYARQAPHSTLPAMQEMFEGKVKESNDRIQAIMNGEEPLYFVNGNETSKAQLTDFVKENPGLVKSKAVNIDVAADDKTAQAIQEVKNAPLEPEEGQTLLVNHGGNINVWDAYEKNGHQWNADAAKDYLNAQDVEPAALHEGHPERDIIEARHATTAEDNKGVTSGPTDVPLNDEGRQQAASLGDDVKDKGISRVVSSDLPRAEETGKIIADKTGAEHETVPGLKSWDIGEFDKTKDPEFKEAEKYFVAHPTKTEYKGKELGESFGQYKDRIIEARAALEPDRVPAAKEAGLYSKAGSIEDLQDPRALVMQHFANGGKINPSAIKELYGGKDERIRINASTEGERRRRIGLIKNSAPGIDELAHQLWESSGGSHETGEFKEAIEQVLQEHTSRASIAKELVNSYIDNHVRENLSEKEAKEIDDGMLQKIHAELNGVDPALKNELSAILQKYQDQYGTVDWEKMEEDFGGFDPEMLSLSEDATSQLNSLINAQTAQSGESGDAGIENSGSRKSEGPTIEQQIDAAQSAYDSAARDLKQSENKIAKTNATQTGMFDATQKGMFDMDREEAKSILDPLRAKVKEAKAALDELKNRSIEDPDQQDLFNVSDIQASNPEEEEALSQFGDEAAARLFIEIADNEIPIDELVKGLQEESKKSTNEPGETTPGNTRRASADSEAGTSEMERIPPVRAGDETETRDRANPGEDESRPAANRAPGFVRAAGSSEIGEPVEDESGTTQTPESDLNTRSLQESYVRENLNSQKDTSLKNKLAENGMSEQEATDLIDKVRAEQNMSPEDIIKQAMAIGKTAGKNKQTQLFPEKEGKAMEPGLLKTLKRWYFDGKDDVSDVKSIIRKNKGNEEFNIDKIYHETKKLVNFWNSVPKVKQMAFMLGVEKPELLAGQSQSVKDMASGYRARLDKTFEIIGNAMPDLNYIEDYFPHFWDKPEEARNFFSSTLSKAPLEGSKTFAKKRFFETIVAGLKEGYKLSTTNPEEIVRLAEANAWKFKTAHDIFSDMKDRGYLKYSMNAEKPEGWKTVSDPLFTKMAATVDKNGNADLVRGAYYMPPDVAKLINGYLSLGIRSPVKTFIQQYNNIKNLFQLGVGFFHVGTTSLDAMVSGMTNGIQKLTAGNPRGLIDLATLGNLPATLMRGFKAKGDWNKGIVTADVQALMDANAKVGRQKMYSLDTAYNMKKAFGMLRADADFKQIPKLMWNTMLYLPEAINKPLMEHWVPALKVGGYLRALDSEITSRKNMTPAELQTAKQKIWDSMDDRLGQVVYDNVFMNKSAKDLGFMAIRSAGWTGGTIRAVSGGLAELPRSGQRLVRGQGLSQRTAYLAALPLTVGIMGAMYQYLMTGKGPDEMKDYMFPKDGTVNPDGTDHRVALPSYMKDILSYSKSPVSTLTHKTAPFLNDVVELYNNKDFYGEKIYNRDDPAYQKGMDVLKHEGESMEPFSFKQKPGDDKPFSDQFTTPQGIEQKFGIMAAPKERERNDLQNKISQAYQDQIGTKEEGSTHEEMEKNIARRHLREFIFNGGDYKDASQEWKDAAAVKPRALGRFIQDSHLDPYVRQFKNLTDETKAKLFSQMNDEDKETYGKYVPENIRIQTPAE